MAKGRNKAKVQPLELRASFWLNRAVGSLIAGAITGAVVLGAVAYDDLQREYAIQQRQAFYGWVLLWNVLPASTASTLTYLFLPSVLRLATRQRPIHKQVEQILHERAIDGADPEVLARLQTLRDITEAMDV